MTPRKPKSERRTNAPTGMARLRHHLASLQSEGLSLSAARGRVADKLGVSGQTIANLAAGGLPRASLVAPLADALGVDVETFARELAETR